MIEGLSVLAIIPARGGSKGIPGKNLVELRGRPLLTWSVQAALGSAYIDRLVVSSDSDRILEAAAELGEELPLRRPPELSQDDSPAIAVVDHALSCLKWGAEGLAYDLVVLLQPTSPLRTTWDIDSAIERVVKEAAPSCVSVTRPRHHPAWMFRVAGRGELRSLGMAESGATRRQDLGDVYALNGAVYVARRDWLTRERSFVGAGTLAHVMPKERSVDIDSELDLLVADALLGSVRSDEGA